VAQKWLVLFDIFGIIRAPQAAILFGIIGIIQVLYCCIIGIIGIMGISADITTWAGSLASYEPIV
jgi:hypothetical protein